jgi:hypothetical protein
MEIMTMTKAADLLSGPGGLASFLMGRRQLGARLNGPSLPLDDRGRHLEPRENPQVPRQPPAW